MLGMVHDECYKYLSIFRFLRGIMMTTLTSNQTLRGVNFGYLAASDWYLRPEAEAMVREMAVAGVQQVSLIVCVMQEHFYSTHMSFRISVGRLRSGIGAYWPVDSGLRHGSDSEAADRMS